MKKTANTRLANFIKHDIADYDKARDFPELDKTSHLSRYLRTGEISIRTIWQALQETEATEGRATFEKELCWRDFYNMIYVSFPNQKTSLSKKIIVLLNGKTTVNFSKRGKMERLVFRSLMQRCAS